jgi:Domain of unknown function (DUF3597)
MMSIFGSILHAIFPAKAADPAPDAPAPDAAPAGAAPAAAASAEPVDVEAVLSALADQKGGGGNWRESIVDLLKLLDIDSSLDARAHLADELGVHAADNGTAEQNVALIKGVWAKLEENGGKVPDSLKA